MPDKYESGTPNVVGIYGLHTSLKYVMAEGLEKIHKKEMALVDYFFKHFDNDDIEIIGHHGLENRTAVISLDFKTKDNAVISFNLERQFNIATRVGMHCAPAAHKTLNTFPNGTIRVSFSYFNTIEEVKYLIDAIQELM
jgi:selenocysteine lyase/cysteine desulfurase